jgi:predicted O-methyltransferase YrrM
MILDTVSVLKGHMKALRREGRARFLVELAASSWRIVKNLSDAANTPRVIRTLARLKDNQPIDQLVALVSSGLGGALRPIQNRNELSRLLKLIQSLHPSIILEIGTAKGGTLFLFSRVCAPSGILMSIDLPGGWYGGGYPAWKAFLYRKFARSHQIIHLLRGDSHSREMSEKVIELLGGKRIDVLFIDGDHSYEGVKKDFINYRNVVRKEGIIVFHDIVYNKFDPDIEVSRFWNEIKSQYETSEIVDDQDQGRFGIGVLHWRGSIQTC